MSLTYVIQERGLLRFVLVSTHQRHTLETDSFTAGKG